MGVRRRRLAWQHLRKAVLDELRNGSSRRHALARISTTQNEIQRECERDAGFARDVEEAELQGISRLFKIVSDAAPKDPKLALSLLRCRSDDFVERNPSAITEANFVEFVNGLVASLIASLPDRREKIQEVAAASLASANLLAGKGMPSLQTKLEVVHTNDWRNTKNLAAVSAPSPNAGVGVPLAQQGNGVRAPVGQNGSGVAVHS